MREIRLRTWDKRMKRMIHFDEIGYCDEYNHIAVRVCVSDIESNDLLDERDFSPFMQFTGFRDKNGKDIYEGDYIQCEDLICRVEWNDFEAGFCFSESGKSIIVTKVSAKEFEVIGNIYELPAILETQEKLPRRRRNMTEEEAKNKWCPMVRDGLDPQGNTAGNNRTPDWSKCIASDCMMWRREKDTYGDDYGKDIPNDRGYCGLGVKP